VIGGLLAVGGGLLYATAHPFLESMLASRPPRFSQFSGQWVAPFLSEFPEFVSTVSWPGASHAHRWPYEPRLEHINQWTVLAA